MKTPAAIARVDDSIYSSQKESGSETLNIASNNMSSRQLEIFLVAWKCVNVERSFATLVGLAYDCCLANAIL